MASLLLYARQRLFVEVVFVNSWNVIKIGLKLWLLTCLMCAMTILFASCSRQGASQFVSRSNVEPNDEEVLAEASSSQNTPPGTDYNNDLITVENQSLHQSLQLQLSTLKTQGKANYDLAALIASLREKLSAVCESSQLPSLEAQIISKFQGSLDAALLRAIMLSVNEFHSVVDKNVTIAEEPRAKKALEYFVNSFSGIPFHSVRLAYADLDHAPVSLTSKMPGQIGALFINPLPSNTFPIILEVVLPKSLGCRVTENEKISVTADVTNEAYSTLYQDTLQSIFGSPYVILVNKSFSDSSTNEMFESVLVHELRHYLDVRSNPDFFKHEKNEVGFAEVPPMELLFDYINSWPEKNAYKEQVCFLKREYKFTVEQVAVSFSKWKLKESFSVEEKEKAQAELRQYFQELYLSCDN